MVDSQQNGDVIDMDDLKETKKYSKKRLKLYAIINIITGIVAIIIQIVFYALNYTGCVVYVSTGFWGGALFIIEGVIILKTKFFKVIHYGAALMILLGAFFGGFYLSLGINEYKYEDSIGLAIVISFAGCGVFAMWINSCIIYHIKMLANVNFLIKQQKFPEFL